VSIASPLTLFVAALLASPTFYTALTVGGVGLTDLATRFLICVPAAAVMLMVLRRITEDFGIESPRRRAADHAVDRRA
jgi:hypothetical protein